MDVYKLAKKKSLIDEKKLFTDVNINILKSLKDKKMTIDEITYYVKGATKSNVLDLFEMGVIVKVKEPDNDNVIYINTTTVDKIISDYESKTYQWGKLNGWV